MKLSKNNKKEYPIAQCKKQKLDELIITHSIIYLFWRDYRFKEPQLVNSGGM